MFDRSEKLVQKLFEKELITGEQYQEFKEYKDKKIFSVNAELLFLLYLSVLFFTSGIGIFVYKNIDSIGHLIILTLNFILMLACFFLCFRKSKPYSNKEVSFENPIYDYVLLTGSILACVFLGYVNYRYHVFGTDYRWVSLFSAIICFASAYYFDNKTVLSMGITALTAFVGITLTPKTLIENEIYNNIELIYSGFALGAVLVLAVELLDTKNIKKHFHFVYVSLTIHLMGVSLIAGLLLNQWYVFAFFTIVYVFYFLKLSYRFSATSLFVFTLIYGYIALTSLLGKAIKYLGLDKWDGLVISLTPLFFIGSIILFIKLVHDFNKKKYDSLR